MNIFKKRGRSPEEQVQLWKKRFIILSVLFVLFISGAGFYTYLNYDILAFKHFITQNYIYKDTLDQLYSQELKRDAGGKYYSYFDDIVVSLVTKRIRELNNDKYTFLYTPEKYESYIQYEKDEAAKSEIKPLNDDTLYFHITNFTIDSENFVKSNMPLMKKYKYLIMDFRDNPGGDSYVMNRLADLFLPKGSILSTDRMRITDWTYKAKSNKDLKYQKIIILQNKNSASASENFITALKDNLDNVTLMGEKSFGKGIGQFTLPLRRGFAVKATTLLWFTPRGMNIQGNGINPDIYYTEKDILEYAQTLCTEPG
jgi:C-terminal peptidase prc